MARRHLPKTLTADEVEQLRATPNLSVPTGLRDRCVIELMLRCGLRVSEVCGLHLRDVDWRAGEIRLRPEITKGAREAVAYLDPPTQQLLERWKDTRRQFAAGKPWLFVAIRADARGQPITRRAVHKMVSRRGERAGIDRPIWPHMLRHTFATTLLSDGFTISEVQRLVRHADLRTTAVYLEVRDVDLAAKVRNRK